MRALPEALKAFSAWEREVAQAAARYLDEAMGLGALAAPKFLELRIRIERQKARKPNDWQWGTWQEAIVCLVPELFDRLGPVGAVIPTCEPIADLLAREADRLSNEPQPAAKSEQGGGGGGANATAAQPKQQGPVPEWLTRWAQILAALKLKKSDKPRVARLNKQYDGPIKTGKRGHQPLVEGPKLMQWWRELEARFEESKQRQQDTQATVANRHSFGREGEVVPEIDGGVKKRRRDRKA
jgi:hypothetical protein